MRVSVPATAMGLCLMPLCAALATTLLDSQIAAIDWGSPTAVPASTSAPDTSSDAAARHAKRTACLKQAKTKKLVGADKTAFIKDCLAAH